MEISRLILAALVGFAILATYIIVERRMVQKKRSSELLDRIAGENRGMSFSEAGDSLQSLERKLSPNAEMLRGLMRLIGMNVDKAAQAVEKRLFTAGIESPDAPIYFVFFQRIVSFLLLLFTIPFFMSNKEGLLLYADIFIGVLISIAAIFGPKLWLENTITKRKQKLSRSFPDALDLLLICVESGLALDAALSRVCKELGSAHPLITEELNRTRLELALLNDRVKALTNLAERTDLVAFRSLVASLIQTEKFGTSLSDTLRVLADDFRQVRLLNAENKAARLPALMTVPLIFFLLPAFMCIILGPAFVRVAAQGGIFGKQ